MKCSLLLAAASAALLLPATASAQVTELGELPAGATGSCPQNPCQALTRATAYQAKVGPDRGLHRAPADGRIVAWNVALGDPGLAERRGFDDAFGRPQAAIVVLRPGDRLVHRVVHKGPMTDLRPWLGRSVRFPLAHTLPIREGDRIGLTVPTWAPVLQVGQPGTTSWRGSRPQDRCADVTTQRAMLGRRRTASFRCLYRTARLTYSATFVPDPEA